jgi:DNA-directed RNA polymerase I subunit RPA1
VVFGAVSEKYEGGLEGFIRGGVGKRYTSGSDTDVAAEQFRALMKMNYTRSLIAPGESVGVLCAQGIGEPSTQMTLNTFHLAGHGAANVTLGTAHLS